MAFYVDMTAAPFIGFLLEKHYRVIKVKDLRIHEVAISKDQTNVPTYDAIMAPDTNILSEPVVISPPTSTPKRGRGRLRKNIHVKHILSLLSDKALVEPDHVHTSEDRHAEDPLVLLARTLEKEGSSGLQDYDALSHLDVAEPQTYNQAMKCSHSDNWSHSIDKEHNNLLVCGMKVQLIKLGLSKLHADYSIFASPAGIKGPIFTSFVDDLNIIGPKGSSMISEVKRQLNIAFKMVDMGPISHYLGLKVERNRVNKTLKLSQPTYITKVLEKFHMQNAKSTTTPMKEGSLFRNEYQASESDIKQYQTIVGSIMFAMIETRLDIAFATLVVSRHAKDPGKTHMEAAKHILRYLSATKDRGITFGGGDMSVQSYSDSDWAGDREDRKSTSGYVFMLKKGPISCSRRQQTVALSSTEAEYMVLTLAAKETIWIRLLMAELGLMQDDASPAVNVLEREGAIALANNPVLHSRTKHFDIQHHFIRNEVTEGRIDLTYVPTEHMVADGLTKPLTHVKFFSFIRQLHMDSATELNSHPQQIRPPTYLI